MDVGCPTSTADVAHTFIHHSDSLSGSLVASSAPGGTEKVDVGKVHYRVVD